MSKKETVDTEAGFIDSEDAILGDDPPFTDGEEETTDTFEEHFEDVFEETLLPNGEHELIILKLAIEKSKKTPDRKMLHVVLESTQDETAKELHDYMLFENAALGDNAKQMNRRKLRRKNFYTAFGIDPSAGVVCSEAVGLTGFAVVVTQEDTQFGKQSKIKDYTTGA